MSLTLEHQEDVCFSARFGEHEVTIDLPQSHGGQGRGMAPPQLFVAALGGCAGVYVADYCDSQGIDYRGMRLNVDWGYDDRPRRISSVRIRVELPDQALTPAQLQGMLDTVHQCTLHNTLAQRPQLDAEVVAAASALSSAQRARAGNPCENGACCRAAH
jgi:ribosomal protein S12 methylthiotransferase accessory factor